MQRTRSTPSAPSVDDRFLGREPLVRLYSLPRAGTATPFSVGAAEYMNNGGFSTQDLTRQQVWNEQALRNVTHVVGADVGVDTESALDVQMLSQAADGAALWFWNSPKWLYALAVDVGNAAVKPNRISSTTGVNAFHPSA